MGHYLDAGRVAELDQIDATFRDDVRKLLELFRELVVETGSAQVGAAVMVVKLRDLGLTPELLRAYLAVALAMLAEADE